MHGYDSLRRSPQPVDLQARSYAIGTNVVVDAIAGVRIGMKDHAHLQARQWKCVCDAFGQLQPVMRRNQIEGFVMLRISLYRLRLRQRSSEFTERLIFKQ